MKHSLYVGPALLLVGILSSCGSPLLSSSGAVSSSSPSSSSSEASSTRSPSDTSEETATSTSQMASSDSSLSSSSAASSSLPQIDYIKVFCETSWVNIYTWTDSPKVELQGAWPGTALADYDADWKTFDIVGYTSIHLIFNQGAGKTQTSDLKITAAGYWWYYNSEWYQENPKSGPASSSEPASTSTSSSSSQGGSTSSSSVLPLGSDGSETILQCFDWSCSNILNHLDEIKAAGYTAIQTSPLQQCKDYSSGNTDTSGQWWKLYQPIAFKIASASWTGDASSFKTLCTAAKNKGLKVLVDVVANHLGGDHSYLSDQVNTYEPTIYGNQSQYFHNYFAYDSGNESTYVVTQGSIGMPDLNTGNAYVQSRVLSYLKELIDAGASGFRFDAAKHIELPSDGTYASDFWVNTLSAARTYATSTYNRDLFAYGEILNSAGNSRHYSDYTPYFNALTDNRAGNAIRSAVESNNTGGMASSNYPSGLAAKNTVLWGESHDTYMNGDGESKNSSQSNVDKAYCLVTAHKDASSLYFIRPGSSMNSAASSNYISKAVGAANRFHTQFETADESYSTGSNCAAVQRYGNGMSGALIVTTNSTNFSVSLNNLADGTYSDAVSGKSFTVSNHNVSGTADSSGVVCLVKA